VLKVVFLDPLPGIKIVLSHGLDNESLVFAEEEEAA